MSDTAHCYLNDDEAAALAELERRLDLGQSGVLRVALRRLAGLPVPPKYRELDLELARAHAAIRV